VLLSQQTLALAKSLLESEVLHSQAPELSVLLVSLTLQSVHARLHEDQF